LAFLLSCFDQWGREIVLSDSRWQDHILPDHAELNGNLNSIRQAIEAPTGINFDETAVNGENFYRLGALPAPYDRYFLKVCVRFVLLDVGGPWRGEIVTAYATNKEKRGEAVKWRR